MNIGRKIYYDCSTGIILWDLGERSGNVTPTTYEQDLSVMPLLGVLQSKNQLGTLQLNYGDYSSNFQSCKGYYINVADSSIVFL